MKAYKTAPYDEATARRLTDGSIKGFISTRSGNTVRLLCHDAKGDYPLTGLVDVGSCEVPMQWSSIGNYTVGRYARPHRNDLVLHVAEEGGDGV